ncbi:MAG TPA: hypothetical protein VIE45_16775 [Streptosporangiaceae bacterium]|jgi:hypothetical protein
MSDQPDEALEVLRGVWNAQQQTVADLGDDENPKTCKRMADVGFGGMAGPEEDLRTAWRNRLAREGKLNADSGTVADLVLGQAEGH